MPEVTAICTYPVKSCGGLVVNQLSATVEGMQYDRNWVLRSSSGEVLTQRDLPEMARIVPSLDGDIMELRAPERTAQSLRLKLRPTQNGVPDAVDLWGEARYASDEGDAAAQWFSHALGCESRLYRTDAGRKQTFVDVAPILVMFQESLDELNSRLPQKVQMSRFRPSLVVNGMGAFAEDKPSDLIVGNNRLNYFKPCIRCVVINVDQESGKYEPGELWHTLADLRKFADGKVSLGAYYVAEQDCTMSVGQTVQRA